MNHSCNPNTSPVFPDTAQTVYSTRTIKKGEEITQIYRGHFGDTPFEERQRLLKSMFSFECACQACKERFPLSKDLPASYEAAGLSKDLDLQHEALGEEIQRSLEEVGGHRGTKQALEFYCQRLRLACRHLAEPHMIYLSGRAAVTDCLWLLEGHRQMHLDSESSVKGVYL